MVDCFPIKRVVPCKRDKCRCCWCWYPDCLLLFFDKECFASRMDVFSMLINEAEGERELPGDGFSLLDKGEGAYAFLVFCCHVQNRKAGCCEPVHEEFLVVLPGLLFHRFDPVKRCCV